MRLLWPSELKALGVLSMNSRNSTYIARSNKRHLYPGVDDKLKTKQLAVDWGMAVPELCGVVNYQYQVKSLDQQLEGLSKFVIKPAQGSGGKGILVVVDRQGDHFIKPNGEVLDLIDLQRHISNILSGLYSLGGRMDVAMIEALVNFDKAFGHYTYEGLPDIRVLVYKGYPVMAMLRCSTHASDGKANLHQGAVGVGLDMGTGKGLFSVQNDIRVQRHPDTGYVFDDLEIPHWNRILKLASGCFEMTGLGYLGADIVIDSERGPLVLELNARPGLAIQIANQAGLKQRLEYIDSLSLSRDPDERVATACRAFAVI